MAKLDQRAAPGLPPHIQNQLNFVCILAFLGGHGPLMAIGLIFSCLLNTWQSGPGINAWADEHLGGVDLVISQIKKEEQILCTLEHQHLLAYDARWKKSENLKVPKECQEHGKLGENLELIEYRSESLASPEKKTAWNHKVDINLKGLPAFTLFVRADAN